MKDSGVPWIGEIPKDWPLRRIGQMYTERKTKVSDVDYPPLSVTMKGVVPQLSTAAKTDAHDDRKLVLKGDFAINSRSDRRGSCGIAQQDGSVSLINTILCPKDATNPDYLNWLFHSCLFADEFYRWGHGIVDDLWTTNWSDMKRISIPYPSLSEQRCIADFLDGKCAELDSVLEQTKASIEEYKALKQSVITDAVTKGIRGNRPMKDSGVEWIGEIPEEWRISRVGLHFEIILGKMLCSEPLDLDYSLEKYYCAANVHFSGADNSDLKSMWFNPKEKELYHVKEGDLLVVEGGAGAGGSAVVRTITEDIYIQNSIMIVRPHAKSSVVYLRYLLESLVTRGYVDFACNKATIPHFTKDKLGLVPFPLPDVEEQQEIAAYLDEKCAVIDSLIASKEALIGELELYKKSLIYEYVTGKKEVIE